MRIILIRHGETYANTLFGTLDQILIGALDAPISQLNEKGKQQAIETRKQLENMKIDEIYSSDLGRTKETTSIIFPNRDFETTPLLRERTLGSDEGRKADVVFSNPDSKKYYANETEDSVEECMSKRVDDGENYHMVFERCHKFLERFDFNEDKTIAFVAHFHLIRCMTYTLLEKKPDKELFTMMVSNAKPMIFDYQDGKFTLSE